MTKEEAVSYIDSYTWSTMRLGLDRTRELLERLGNPQKRLKFIHVAGSNGKGSTCSMLDSILREAGYKTGLYTSPYIEDFSERFRINGTNIPDDRLAEITEAVKVHAEAMEDHPSQFELVTAIALRYFAEEQCDIVVLEVGLGGLLDSTNVIDAPEAAVITNIGLEHTEFLGNTITEIAKNKAGIIKPGCSVVCYDGPEEAKAVVRSICEEQGNDLVISDLSKLNPLSCDLTGQKLDYKDRKGLHLALLGDYQLRNTTVVLDTIDILRKRGWNVTEEQIRNGLRKVTWPARFEVLNLDPLFILDGGHNPQCAEALSESLRDLLPGETFVFLTGVLADKDYPAIMATIAPLADEFVTVTPDNDRALTAEDLARYLEEHGSKASAAASVEEGLRKAFDLAGPHGKIVSFGSLYMAGAVRSAYKKEVRNRIRKSMISMRKALSAEAVAERSSAICDRITDSEEYKAAKTIFLYKAVNGEADLSAVAEKAVADGKTVCYPLCIDRETMECRIPENEYAWKSGAYHIPEPDPEHSALVTPEDIDLALCPLTAFDENGMRLGMGAGYYDRYLQKCRNAHVIGVAYEAQKVNNLPAETWDVPMDGIMTEMRRYFK